jgi:hypothetical protein
MGRIQHHHYLEKRLAIPRADGVKVSRYLLGIGSLFGIAKRELLGGWSWYKSLRWSDWQLIENQYKLVLMVCRPRIHRWRSCLSGVLVRHVV